MIEKKFIAEQIKHNQVQEYIAKKLGNNASYSHTEIKRTPLGEKIIVYSNKPGLIVGKKGANIKELTDTLKNKFKMENPQIEVAEIANPCLDAKYMARRLVDSFEKFGPKRFKVLGYHTLEEIMNAGALGVEIIISGRGVPSSRAKSWRFSKGLLIKCGEPAETEVKKSCASANLRSGTIGIKVSILPPTIKMIDRITLKEISQPLEVVEVQEKREEGVKITKKKEKLEKSGKTKKIKVPKQATKIEKENQIKNVKT